MSQEWRFLSMTRVCHDNLADMKPGQIESLRRCSPIHVQPQSHDSYGRMLTRSSGISGKHEDVFLVYCTHQDGGDDVSSVLQAVRLVAASHEAGSGHILLIFVPVANLRRGECNRVKYA